MIGTSFIYWVFIVILGRASCEVGTEKPCRHRRYNGTCTTLNACPFVVAILNIGDIPMLTQIVCGYEGNVLKFCCPSSDRIVFEDNNPNVPSVTPKIEITTRFAPEAETSEDRKMNTIVSKRPLFPDRTVCGKHEFDFEDRIVGGDLTKIGEFPWMARIKSKQGSQDKYFCSGSLITDRHVLTAAHCLKSDVLSVRLGEWDESTELDCQDGICSNDTIDVDIEAVILHPKFNKSNKVYDIGIIKLAKPVNFTDTIRPICLPSSPYVSRLDNSFDIDYIAAGWGLTEYQKTSQIKRKVTLRSVKTSFCENLGFPSWLQADLEQYIICAGGEKGRDTCLGDSGGPLMREVREDSSSNWYLFGITSFGQTKCGSEGYPSAYTRVSKYMDWIRQNVT
ncbi:CLIP domain-containing serine protease 14D-like [Zerene cesonia]|uniref:CLIP domain-containing serine protease 14D-like n=1 Tax=Zerene cesonia TaxID=33412 RepID=UPI0018E4FCFB|nr:CLIP domain-containing serine protease 14D-like [Zerene cesonia]